jgi:hypothetical protein
MERASPIARIRPRVSPVRNKSKAFVFKENLILLGYFCTASQQHFGVAKAAALLNLKTVKPTTGC